MSAAGEIKAGDIIVVEDERTQSFRKVTVRQVSHIQLDGTGKEYSPWSTIYFQTGNRPWECVEAREVYQMAFPAHNSALPPPAPDHQPNKITAYLADSE